MSSDCLVFYTSGGISSNPTASLFLIFLSTELNSSRVNCPSLMSNCLLIILVIGSYVTFGGFPSRFWKCCFHSVICSYCFVAFSLALAVLFLLLSSFIVCHAILDCLSSTEFLILSIWFSMYSVCSFRYMLANSFCAFFGIKYPTRMISFLNLSIKTQPTNHLNTNNLQLYGNNFSYRLQNYF